MLCLTPIGESLFLVVLLVIGEESRNHSLITLVLARLQGFSILIFSLLLPPTDACLPTVGIVSAAISNKTGFVEWHASRGGWVCYM